MKDIKEKIEEFKNLNNGWYFGEGVSTLSCLSNKIESLCDFLLDKNIQKINVFPGVSGEIMFSIYQIKYNLDIIIEINGGFTFICEDSGDILGGDIEYEENISFENVKEKIIKYISLG
jgi:hypothetical protein